MELTLRNLKGLMSAEGFLRERTRQSLLYSGIKSEETIEFALKEAKEELEIIEYVKGYIA